MRIAVLGTGDVGQMLANRVLSKGHAVRLGSRSTDNEKGQAWAASAQGDAALATFADAAAFADLAILAVSGAHALSVVESAGAGLHGKVLIDLTNPLDFSVGFPPRLSVCNDDSLGEQIQRSAPQVRVVKTLNTLSNPLMLDPARLAGPHDILLCGDDASAKRTVTELLQSFGWAAPIDLGDLTNARALEMWLPMWTRLYRALGTADFNLHIQRGA
ncbi:MAG: NAD(P)-binding domain-containing protein [Myxococcota bacterium]